MKTDSEESQKGWFRRGMDKAKTFGADVARGLRNTFFKSNSSDDNTGEQIFHRLSHSVGQERALCFFLSPRERMLKNLELSDINFAKATNNIFHVYDQLYLQNICLGDYASVPWKAEALPKVKLNRVRYILSKI